MCKSFPSRRSYTVIFVVSMSYIVFSVCVRCFFLLFLVYYCYVACFWLCLFSSLSSLLSSSPSLYSFFSCAYSVVVFCLSLLLCICVVRVFVYEFHIYLLIAQDKNVNSLHGSCDETMQYMRLYGTARNDHSKRYSSVWFKMYQF